MNDLDLLRRYEPIIRFTAGELFYPFPVDAYVSACSLWMRDENGAETKLVEDGELTLEKLAEFDDIPPEHTLYLRFVQKPLSGLAYQMGLIQMGTQPFKAPGRLARVGLVPRMLDALFDLSLVIRGTVPGGTTVGAAVLCHNIQQRRGQRYPYYARVRREGGYIILHYLFFYAMNNWRSTFSGVNDHEADWEQIFVYLSDEVEPVPLWVAYASHDFSGDDLRRRWDDPELVKYGETHPVIYAGAGSHASYFLPGEYLMQVQPQFMKPLTRFIHRARAFWAERLGQGVTEEDKREVELLFSIPFIDYARGDGVSIGPQQERQWEPMILTPEDGWAERYRGLWGLDTQDLLGGERAPGGPKFNRDGTVRQAWYNPLGWAGLTKIPPPAEARRTLEQYIEQLQTEHIEVSRNIDAMQETLRLQSLEVQALQEAEYLKKLYQEREQKLKLQNDKLNGLYQRRAELAETLEATRQHLERIQLGQWGKPQAHIHHKHLPEPPQEAINRVIELWAAVSSGLLIVAFVSSVIIAPGNWAVRLALVLSVFVVIEVVLRKRLANLLVQVTIGLGILTAGILVVQFWDWLVLSGLIVAAYLLTMENLKELRR